LNTFFLGNERLKVLFVIRSLAHFSYISTIVDALARGDNKILLYFDPKWSKGHSFNQVRRFTNNSDNVTAGWALQRSDAWRRFIFFTRELRSYTSYLNRKDQSPYYINRWNRYLPRLVRNITHTKPARKILTNSFVYRLLKYFEYIVPPDQKIYSDLIKKSPDIVVATPMNMRFSEEVEYVKAANILKIPTVLPVLSWDNLTTKGLFHIIPNLTLVWNEVQRQEAINIHEVPDDKIFITGSPFFDKWFASDHMRENRSDFCWRIGLDSKRPFILYLGSSTNIARDETWIVEEIYDRIKSHMDNRIRNLAILVRPHPANTKHYTKLKGKDILLWPKEGALPEDEKSQRDFYNVLFHSILTIGVNTSAMIDAVINKKPCLTIMTKQYLTTQQQALHFKHLLEADVLEVTYSPEEAIVAIAKIMAGKDRHRNQRLWFVKNFVRPCGLNREVGQVAAHIIELAAKGKRASEIRSSFSD
jgi:hypothetical protein